MILSVGVTILPNHYDILIVHEGQHSHALAELAHAINGRLAIRHLGDVFAQAHPLVLVDFAGGEGFPRLGRHEDSWSTDGTNETNETEIDLP
jgi:hypothetical protein